MQMLLKLAVAKELSTEFYVTLDCDVLLTQPLAFSDLVRNGRGVILGEVFPYATRHSESWWAAADDLLRAEGALTRKADQAPHGGRVIGVTPAVLSRSIALRVASRLEEIHGGRWLGCPWDEILFRALAQDAKHRDWSEYTLYYTAGAQWNGSLEALHVPGPRVIDTGTRDADTGRLRRRLYLERGFEYGDWTGINFEDAFKPMASAFFLVVQSISGASPQWVLQQTEPLLFLAEHDAKQQRLAEAAR